MRVVVISGQPPATALPERVAFFPKPFYPVDLLREPSRYGGRLTKHAVGEFDLPAWRGRYCGSKPVLSDPGGV
jgi:hypothetical protein